MVLHLDETAFRKWDASLHRWRVYPGEYEVRVASSSRDICLTASIIVADGQSAFNLEQARHRRSIAEEKLMFDQAPMPSPQVPEMYRQPIPGCFVQPESARAFEELYARPLPERPPVTPVASDSTVSDMGACWLGRRLYRIIDWVMAEPASKMNLPHHRLGHGRAGKQDEPRSKGDDAGDGRRHAAAVSHHERKMNRDQKAMMQEMAADMPLRSLTTSGIPLESVKGFVSLLNGHYLTGFIYAVRYLFRK